jgi:hypothetical protein
VILVFQFKGIWKGLSDFIDLESWVFIVLSFLAPKIWLGSLVPLGRGVLYLWEGQLENATAVKAVPSWQPDVMVSVCCACNSMVACSQWVKPVAIVPKEWFGRGGHVAALCSLLCLLSGSLQMHGVQQGCCLLRDPVLLRQPTACFQLLETECRAFLLALWTPFG